MNIIGYRLYQVVSLDGIRLDGWPWCAVCKKPVDTLTRISDPANSDLIIEARCHGSVDRTVIDRRDMEDGPLNLYGGTAFKDEVPGRLLDMRT